ncbi:amino acid ABC transporter permease [Clostridium sp. D2Q-11]|uniref:Amino acid ABC transporter permease n=1 Tax=Anaeromonas frigoriresistens TaxID=2683708 RepID=A0A942Z8V6_9FIRM|nr:amino acid ABC transporter permease [Anaeromonas frigoriresistens]MBS4538673.1 amino acid ABC transporter permease [Anaeromonas frigoriresistens]
MQDVYNVLPSLLEGLINTIKIFLLTLSLSIPLGIITALIRLSSKKGLEITVRLYIWIMRGTPLLLQIVFIYFGLPIIGVSLNRFTAVIIAFVINYGAYFAEIFRSGISSIDKGQYEGARVLGLNPIQTFRRIILPQTVKRVLPPVANETITLVKDTALVYVVGIGELLRAAKIASNRDATLIPLVTAALMYLILTAILSKVFGRYEEKYAYYR